MTLVNREQPEVVRRLAVCEELGLGALPGLIEAARELFEIVGPGPGLELACRNEVRGRPNACRLTIVGYGDGKMAVLFFRVSTAPGSTDRFGYGGLAVQVSRLRPLHLEAWLGYVASGFDWRRAPRGLRREFQFPVPDPGGAST